MRGRPRKLPAKRRRAETPDTESEDWEESTDTEVRWLSHLQGEAILHILRKHPGHQSFVLVGVHQLLPELTGSSCLTCPTWNLVVSSALAPLAPHHSLPGAAGAQHPGSAHWIALQGHAAAQDETPVRRRARTARLRAAATRRQDSSVEPPRPETPPGAWSPQPSGGCVLMHAESACRTGQGAAADAEGWEAWADGLGLDD